MVYIDIKCLKTLLRQSQNKPGLDQTINHILQRYNARVHLKLSQYDVLHHIAQKINRRHKKNKVQTYARFGNSQLKLFCWVTIIYCHCESLILQQFSQNDFNKIHAIFHKIELDRIKYEIKSFYLEKNKIDGEWTQEETKLFLELVEEKKASEWKVIAYQMFKRSNCNYFRFFQQYREKWINYLNPNIDKGQWTLEEEIRFIQLVIAEGHKWSSISRLLNGIRSEHSVKNHYHKLQKNLLKCRGFLDKNQTDRDQQILKSLLQKQAYRQCKKQEKQRANINEEVKEEFKEPQLNPSNKIFEKNSTVHEACHKEEDSEYQGYVYYPTPVPLCHLPLKFMGHEEAEVKKQEEQLCEYKHERPII